jgi:glycosyltransferase involved in cell wall biosynthesis
MVLDAHDVITKPAERQMNSSHGLGRLFAGLKYLIIKAAERRIMKRFNIIITLSEFDRNYLLKLMPNLLVKTVPIPAGLDISERSYEPQKNTILFLASFKYRKVNVNAALYFYRYVFPLISEQVPGARFIIAGYGPPQELKVIADENPRVEVLGFVEDIDRCYKEAEVFVAPILTGGGIIVKILDALAAGVPVVTTSYGNEGIGASPGKELLVGDDPASMAAGVIKLLEDKKFADFISTNGKAYVQSHYNLNTITRKREEIYRNLRTGFESSS